MNFANPGWLALLILIPLLGIGGILASRLKKRQWSSFVAPRLRERLLKKGSALPRWLALLLLLAACCALIVSMARPRGDAGTRTEKTLGRNVMVALDISRSMRVNDVKPDRLAQAKVVIYELLEAMPDERIGFMAFAGNSYVYAPLTIDHTAVKETVEQIDEKWAPLGGSDLASAVKLATETLKETGQKNNALVILSDGERHDDDLENMIAEASAAGVRIVAIAVGTEDGGIVPNSDFPNGQMIDRSGRTVISQLHTEVMRKLAEETSGRFAIAGSGLDIPAMVKSVVKDMDAFEIDGRARKISIEFYQWLLFPAIILLAGSIIAGTRWKAIRAVAVLAGGLLIIQPADASEATRAMEALKGERHEEARDSYHKLAEAERRDETRARYRLGEGTAAYRAGDFRGAREAFSRAILSGDPAVRSGGHQGLGNTLFQLGWKGLSGEAYPTDPESIPDINRFDTIVKEALAKMRESDAAEERDSGGYVKFESLITNWADAVKHYDSTLALTPADPLARSNRVMTITYLKRLQELLKQEEEDGNQALGQAQPGEGPPQEGQDGEGEGDPKDGKGGKGKGKAGEGEGDKEDREGQGDEGEEKNQGKKGKEESENEGDDGNNPNESPQERAHRLLKENADTEKGPLTPGRREFRDAEKDW
ncbi:MAG: VWA domain-containing protein [Verrucomicrobiaceae bacterium]|nr:MAG: VWA domain-containing protein [Verrucomicrobiaceae bacterium]